MMPFYYLRRFIFDDFGRKTNQAPVFRNDQSKSLKRVLEGGKEEKSIFPLKSTKLRFFHSANVNSCVETISIIFRPEKCIVSLGNSKKKFFCNLE